MEIAQLCKSTCNNQLQQSIYFCHKRNMSQIWQVNALCQSQSKRSHHDAHLHPLTNVPTKCQPSTPNRIQEIAQTKTHGHYDKVKGQIKIIPGCFRPTTPNQYPYKVSTSYILWFQRYCLDKILMVYVNTARSKVKTGSHHDVSHLQPLSNVPTMYKLPTSYGF